MIYIRMTGGNSISDLSREEDLYSHSYIATLSYSEALYKTKKPPCNTYILHTYYSHVLKRGGKGYSDLST